MHCITIYKLPQGYVDFQDVMCTAQRGYRRTQCTALVDPSFLPYTPDGIAFLPTSVLVSRTRYLPGMIPRARGRGPARHENRDQM